MKTSWRVAGDGLNDSDQADSAGQREAIAICWIDSGPEAPISRNLLTTSGCKPGRIDTSSPTVSQSRTSRKHRMSALRSIKASFAALACMVRSASDDVGLPPGNQFRFQVAIVTVSAETRPDSVRKRQKTSRVSRRKSCMECLRLVLPAVRCRSSDSASCGACRWN
jgi:hypothetical protein